MMDDSGLEDYTLDQLISIKYRKINFHDFLQILCTGLLQDQNLDKAILVFAWGFLRFFVFNVGSHLGKKESDEIFDAFNDVFNRAGEPSIEFLSKHIADYMFYELAHTDWKAFDTHQSIPFDVSVLESGKTRVKTSRDDQGLKAFFRDYVRQDKRHFQRPVEKDIRAFAQKTLILIEVPETKELLEKISFGPFTNLIPEEIDQTLAGISKLTLRDGKMFLAARPLLVHWERDYALRVATPKKEHPQPPESKGRGGKIDVWLDWYHAMLDNGFKCTLEEIARKSGYSLGYVKQKHMVYKARPNQKT